MSNEKNDGFESESSLENSITADDCEIIRNFHSFFKIPLPEKLSTALSDFEKRPSRQTLECLQLEVAMSLTTLLKSRTDMEAAGIDPSMIATLESELFTYMCEDAKKVADKLQFEISINNLLSEQNND